jgi:hypothetical protein
MLRKFFYMVLLGTALGAEGPSVGLPDEVATPNNPSTTDSSVAEPVPGINLPEVLPPSGSLPISIAPAPETGPGEVDKQPLRAPEIQSAFDSTKENDGYLNIVIEDFGGGGSCNITDYVFEVTLPDKTVQKFDFDESVMHNFEGMDFPYETSGLYQVVMYGTCANGETTPRSNVVKVNAIKVKGPLKPLLAPTAFKQINKDSTTGVTVSWKVEDEGQEPDFLSVRCFLAVSDVSISPTYCEDSDPISVVSNIPVNATTVSIPNLNPSTLYECFAVSHTEYDESCSQPIFVDYQSWGTCNPGRVNTQRMEKHRCGTAGPSKASTAANKRAQMRAYGMGIINMSVMMIKEKVDSFPGAKIPLHFMPCFPDSDDDARVTDAVLSQQVSDMNRVYSPGKIAFTKGQIVSCNPQTRKKLADVCDADFYESTEKGKAYYAAYCTYNKEYCDARIENYGEQIGRIIIYSDICKDAVFAVDGVTQQAQGITVVMPDTSTLGLLGVSSGIGLGDMSSGQENPIMLVGWTLLPGIQGGDPKFSGGMTLAHEIGHKLGLAHPWEERPEYKSGETEPSDYDSPLGAPDPNDGCFGKDPMPSTPHTQKELFGCSVGTDSCPMKNGRDPINNIMHYSDDCCLLNFSMEQILLMQANILTYRPEWLAS